MPDSSSNTNDAVGLGDLPDVLTVAEAARFLRLGRNATYEAIQRGEIPSIKIGRRVLVPKCGLRALLAAASSGLEGNR